MFVLTPLEDQRRLARTLIGHWTDGPGRETNPDRAEALGTVSVAEHLEDAVVDIRERTGRTPRLVLTSARAGQASGGLPLDQVRRMLDDEPVLVILGTGHGLDMDAMDQVLAKAGLTAETLRPLRCLDAYNHLSVRSAAAIMVDRLLADTD